MSEIGRQEDRPLFPRLREESALGLGRDSRHLLLEAQVSPREELHFFFAETRPQKKLKEGIIRVAGGEKPLQLLEAVGLRNALHIAWPVAAFQNSGHAVCFEQLLTLPVLPLATGQYCQRFAPTLTYFVRLQEILFASICSPE